MPKPSLQNMKYTELPLLSSTRFLMEESARRGHGTIIGGSQLIDADDELIESAVRSFEGYTDNAPIVDGDGNRTAILYIGHDGERAWIHIPVSIKDTSVKDAVDLLVRIKMIALEIFSNRLDMAESLAQNLCVDLMENMSTYHAVGDLLHRVCIACRRDPDNAGMKDPSDLLIELLKNPPKGRCYVVDPEEGLFLMRTGEGLFDGGFRRDHILKTLLDEHDMRELTERFEIGKLQEVPADLVQ